MPTPHWLMLAEASPRLDSVFVRETMACPVRRMLSVMSKWPLPNPDSRSSGLEAHWYMMFSLIPPFGMRTKTGRPWNLPSKSPLPVSPQTGPLNRYAPLLGLPGSWRPENTVPSRLMRNRAGPDGLLMLFDCWHSGWTFPGGVGSGKLLGLGQPLTGKIALT